MYKILVAQKKCEGRNKHLVYCALGKKKSKYKNIIKFY